MAFPGGCSNMYCVFAPEKMAFPGGSSNMYCVLPYELRHDDFSREVYKNVILFRVLPCGSYRDNLSTDARRGYIDDHV